MFRKPVVPAMVFPGGELEERFVTQCAAINRSHARR
jgi:hypothetical protein